MAGNGSALMLEACLSFPGADANLPDNEANTPLHFAAQAGEYNTLQTHIHTYTRHCPASATHLSFSHTLTLSLVSQSINSITYIHGE